MASCMIQEGKTVHKLHVLGMNSDLWDRVRGLGSGTWKGRCQYSSVARILRIVLMVNGSNPSSA